MIKSLLAAATIAIVSLSHSQAGAATVDLTTGPQSPHFVGFRGSSTRGFERSSLQAGGAAAGVVIEYRSCLVFDLAGIQGRVTNAEVLMFNGIVQSPNETETLALNDFSASLADVFFNFNQAMFDDLKIGVQYGADSEFSAAASQTTVRTIQLNAPAINAINATLGGYFMMGAYLQSLDPQNDSHQSIAMGAALHPITLRLTVVPEPTAAMLVVPAIICLASIRRRSVA